jgi:hypothetical protein
LVLVAASIASLTAAAGEVVVITSNVPGVAAGATVNGERVVELAAGQRVAVVTGTGRSITWTGPYSGALAADSGPADRSLLNALANLVSVDKGGRTTLGAIRGAPKGSPRDPWAIDIARAGDQCALDGAAPMLWRANAAIPETLVIASALGEATLDWPAKAATLAWPPALALADRAPYLVRYGSAAEPKRLVLHLVPPALPTDAHKAAWMTERGCTRQARAVLAVAAE